MQNGGVGVGMGGEQGAINLTEESKKQSSMGNTEQKEESPGLAAMPLKPALR